MPPSSAGTAIIALFSMYSCSWWPTRYSPSTMTSAPAKPASRSPEAISYCGEDVVGPLGVEDRRERLGHEPDPRAEPADGLPIRRGDERDRLGVVADLTPDRDEDRLVLLDRADEVLAGDVRRGDDDDLRPVRVGVQLDREEAAPGARWSGSSPRTTRRGRRGRRRTSRRRSASRDPRGGAGSRAPGRASWSPERRRARRLRTARVPPRVAATYGWSSGGGFLRSWATPVWRERTTRAGAGPRSCLGRGRDQSRPRRSARPGVAPGVHATLDDRHPADEHVLDALGELPRLVVGGQRPDPRRIEDDDIGDVPVEEAAAVPEPEPGRGHARSSSRRPPRGPARPRRARTGRGSAGTSRRSAGSASLRRTSNPSRPSRPGGGEAADPVRVRPRRHLVEAEPLGEEQVAQELDEVLAGLPPDLARGFGPPSGGAPDARSSRAGCRRSRRHRRTGRRGTPARAGFGRGRRDRPGAPSSGRARPPGPTPGS